MADLQEMRNLFSRQYTQTIFNQMFQSWMWDQRLNDSLVGTQFFGHIIKALINSFYTIGRCSGPRPNDGQRSTDVLLAFFLTPEITVRAYAFCVRVAVMNRFLSIHTICGGFLSFPWKQIPFQNKSPT